jgi:hypothetical protein
MTNMDDDDAMALMPEDLKWPRNLPLVLIAPFMVWTSLNMASSQ